MAGRPDTQPHRLNTLRFEFLQNSADFPGAPLGDDMQDVIQISLGRGRGNGGNIVTANRRVVAALVEGKLFNSLAKITGIKITRQIQQGSHGVLR